LDEASFIDKGATFVEVTFEDVTIWSRITVALARGRLQAGREPEAPD
jgi:hypothetical protein